MGQNGEPLICVTKTLSNTREITDRIRTTIHYHREEQERKSPPRKETA